MTLDDRAMRSLVESSRDLQADAMSTSRESIAELTDYGADRAGSPVDDDETRNYEARRRKMLKAGGYGMGALAASGLLTTAWGQRVAAAVSRPAATGVPVDIQILQTASSLENLAVATYGAALELPFIQEQAVVKAFAEMTMMQHAEHSAAFNAQAAALGGQKQMGTNPKYTPIVENAKPTLTDALAVAKLAATLEEVAGDTYLANLSLLSDGKLRLLMGSVQGVEYQHLATLRAVIALLEGGAPQLIAIPTDVAALPAAAGRVAFPAAFEKPDMASPPAEGALS